MVLEELLTSACTLVLAGCAAWLTLGLVVVLVDVLLTGGVLTATRWLPWPRLLRSVVVASLGAVLVTTPAAADDVATDSAATPDVLGLAVPDRVVSERVGIDRSTANPREVRVRPGDSLWSIAARLAPHADDAALNRAWRLIARANAPRLGPDPDLIFPGVVLVVPDLGATLGKELS